MIELVVRDCIAVDAALVRAPDDLVPAPPLPGAPVAVPR